MHYQNISYMRNTNHCHTISAAKSWLQFSDQSNMESSNNSQGSGKRRSMIIGPWGGNGGTSWDDGTYHGVREIRLAYDRCIDSILVVYDKNGKPIIGEKHGGVGGNKVAEVKLQYPEEFIVSVSGHYCPVVHGGTPVIRSLTFKTNTRTYGPFGVEEGTPFTFSIDGARIVGFKGNCGWYLDSIGFRVSHPQTSNLFQKVHKKLQRLASTKSMAYYKDANINRTKSM